MRRRGWGEAIAACVAIGATAIACASPAEPAGTDAETGGAPSPRRTTSANGVTPSARGHEGEPARPQSCRRDAARTADVALFDAARAAVTKAVGTSMQTAHVDAFLAEVADGGGTPLEDRASDRVVFLARGEGPSGAWAVTTSLVDFDVEAATPMTALEGTDLWFAELRIPRGAPAEYKLVSGTRLLEDPLARNVTWDGITRAYGVRGEMNAVVHPDAWPADRGRLVALGPQHATSLGDAREVFVYLPPRYDDGSCAKLPSVVFHDGNESITRGDFVAAADALYRARPELSAVLVFVGLPSQEVRSAQYAFGVGFRARDYVDFLAMDLWPAVRGSFRVCDRPDARGLSGASLGGLVSTFAVLERPSTWGWVGAQSASFFWGDEELVTRVTNEPKVATRFYLDSGCPGDNCEVTDKMFAALTSRGYEAARVTAHGAGHDWPAWRARIPGLLTHFREGRPACD